MDIFVLLQKNKNVALNMAIILLAIIIGVKIYQGQESQIKSLKKQTQTEIKSNEVFKNLTLLDDKVNAYKRSLKIKNTGEVMNTVSEIAKNMGLKIDSIRPMGEAAGDDYVKFSVSAVIRAKNYNQIGEFMNRLENDNAFFTVDSFRLSQNAQEKGLVLNLRVIAIKPMD